MMEWHRKRRSTKPITRLDRRESEGELHGQQLLQWIRVFLWMAPKTIQRIAKDVPDASQ